jgi:hypothetical protein
MNEAIAMLFSENNQHVRGTLIAHLIRMFVRKAIVFQHVDSKSVASMLNVNRLIITQFAHAPTNMKAILTSNADIVSSFQLMNAFKMRIVLAIKFAATINALILAENTTHVVVEHSVMLNVTRPTVDAQTISMEIQIFSALQLSPQKLAAELYQTVANLNHVLMRSASILAIVDLMLNVLLQAIFQHVAVCQALLVIQFKVALKPDVTAILNVIKIKLAIIRSASIHALSAIHAQSQPRALDKIIDQRANVCPVFKEIHSIDVNELSAIQTVIVPMTTRAKIPDVFLFVANQILVLLTPFVLAEITQHTAHVLKTCPMEIHTPIATELRLKMFLNANSTAIVPLKQPALMQLVKILALNSNLVLTMRNAKF